MTDLRSLLIELVQRITVDLASPLPREELEYGWTEESREAMLALFERLRQDVEAGVRLRHRPEYFTILRGLDHWGISEGPLLQRASRISSDSRR